MIASKSLPFSTEAETAVLGACMLSESALMVASEKLTTEHFYHETHRIIFDTMLTMYRAGQPLDMVTVTQNLQNNGQMAQVGGASRLVAMYSNTPSAANIDQYVAIVLEKSIARELAKVCSTYYDAALDETLDPLQMMVEFQDHALKLGSGLVTPTLHKPRQLAAEVFAHVDAMLEAGSHITGIPTGISDLDFMLGGFKPSELVIVGARPSVGKSALMLSMANNMILAGAPVAIFSIEMSAKALGTRLLKIITGLNLDSYTFLSSRPNQNEIERIVAGVEEMQNMKIYIDDKPNLNVAEFAAKARRYVSEFGCKAIYCDYLQKFQKTNFRLEERHFITEIARMLKNTAKMLDVPVIALSQLKREVDSRADKKPLMSDFMESGNIEAEADVMIGIDRPERYGDVMFSDGTPAAGKAKLCVLKHRNGTIGEVLVNYRKELTLFHDNLPSYTAYTPDEGDYGDTF